MNVAHEFGGIPELQISISKSSEAAIVRAGLVRVWQTHQWIAAFRLVKSSQREVEGDRLGRFHQNNPLPIVPPVSQDMRNHNGQT